MAIVQIVPLLLCITASQFVGIVWYGTLFRSRWVDLHGFTPDKQALMQLDVLQNLFYSFVQSSLVTIVLAHLFHNLKGGHNLKNALHIAFWSWFAFTFASILNHNGWAHQPVELTLIDSGFDLFVYLTCTVVYQKFASNKKD